MVILQGPTWSLKVGEVIAVKVEMNRRQKFVTTVYVVFRKKNKILKTKYIFTI